MLTVETPSSTRACSVSYNNAWEYFRSGIFYHAMRAGIYVERRLHLELKVLSTNGGICRETKNVLPTCFKKHIAIYTQPWHSEEKFKFDADSR